MKKNIIILFLIGLGMAANAQKKKHVVKTEKEYTINGFIRGLTNPYVYITIMGEKDSLVVKHGKFNYKGSVDEPTLVYISYDKPFVQAFYVENVPVEIKGDANTLADVEIYGGKTQNEWRVLEKSTKELRAERRVLRKEFIKANKDKDFSARNIVEERQDILESKINDFSKAFIIKNPKSYVSLNEVNKMQYSNPAYQEYREIYERLDPSFKKSVLVEYIEAYLAFAKRSAIGQEMKDFTQNDPSGKPISLSSLRGKYVLVDFWASWCGPCREENPNVLKVYQQFSEKAFTILGVSLDSNAEKWKKAIEDDKLPWTQVSDLNGWRNEVAVYFGIRGIPANFLLDPNGTIIAKNLMGNDLENKLNELFGKANSNKR